MTLVAQRSAYADLTELACSLDEGASWRSTACAGWTVRDLFQHLLNDAQRALVALATPAEGPADQDATTYWLDSPGAPDSESRGIRATRTMASQWRLDHLPLSTRRRQPLSLPWPDARLQRISSPPKGTCSAWTTCWPSVLVRSAGLAT